MIDMDRLSKLAGIAGDALIEASNNPREVMDTIAVMAATMAITRAKTDNTTCTHAALCRHFKLTLDVVDGLMRDERAQGRDDGSVDYMARNMRRDI